MKWLILLLLICFGSILGLRESSKLRAAAQVAQEGKGCGAPKEWGQLKGVADRAVAFEDSSGTIRVLDLGPCMRGETRLIVKINRQ
jgi:hypothetical protein